jgi:DNA-binding LacI/PurR family transcriptional regulator
MAILTKAQQVEQYLRSAIQSGRWAARERLPGEFDMVEELGVSRPTLREALNSLAKDGVIVRKSGSGTFVADEVKIGTIAILATAEGLTSPLGLWYRTLLEEARKCIEYAGYRAVLAAGYGDAKEDLISSLHVLDQPNIKDVVGVLALMDMEPLEGFLQAQGIHSVMMDGQVPTGRYCVLEDYPRLVEQGCGMLEARGYDEFAFMAFDYTDSPKSKLAERVLEEGTRLTKEALGFDDDRLVWVPWTPNSENAYGVFKEWWSRPQRPNAVFFADDMLCDVATRAIMELGIEVPNELAILTLANVGRHFHFPMNLTGIGFDPTTVASTAWEMLSKLISGEPVDEPIVYIPPVVRKGQSLGERRDQHLANQEMELSQAL